MRVGTDDTLDAVASESPITAPFDALCDAALDRASRLSDDSVRAVYVRGSVARGTAVVGVSDCDVVIVIDRTPSVADRDVIDRPVSIRGVRLDLSVVGIDSVAEGGRRQEVGALLSLEGRRLVGSVVPTAPAILDRTIDPMARLSDVLHRIVVRHEHWSVDRVAWRVLRAAAQVAARETRRFALDLEPTIEILRAAPTSIGSNDVERLAAGVRGDHDLDAAWVIDQGLELLAHEKEST